MQAPLVLVCDTPENLARAAATYVETAIWAARGRAPSASTPSRVAISGGTTPYAMLRLLRTAELPWDQIHWYWVDERFLAADSPRSNVGAAKEALFDHIHAVSGTQVFAPLTPETATLEEAAADYEARLRRDLGEGALDLVLLGIGDDGHTASLFPGEPEVNERTRWVVPVPARAGREPRISLTRPVIEHAASVMLLAQGASKQKAFRAMQEPRSLDEIPSRIVHHTHHRALCLVDAAVVAKEA